MTHTEYCKEQTVSIRQGNQERLKIGEGGYVHGKEDVDEAEGENAEENGVIAEVLADGGEESAATGAVA